MAAVFAASAVEVIQERIAIIGMCAVVDDGKRTVAGAKPTQVCISLLRYQNHDIVLGMVDMGNHGDD